MKGLEGSEGGADVRRGASRVARNDATVLSAGVHVLADVGWSGFTVASVARMAGLSDKAVRSRGNDPGELAAWLWSASLGPGIVSKLSAVVRELEAARASGSAARLVEALTGCVTTDSSSRAVVEALIMGRFEPRLRHAIESDLGAAMQVWLAPSRDADAARAGYAMALALGLMLSAHYPQAQVNLDVALAHHAEALLSDTPPHAVPDRPARHMDDYPELAPGDPALDILLNQTLELVGTHGFDRVTVMEIATSAGVTEGMVFYRYPTKLALFVDATRRQHAAGWQLNHDYAESLAREFPPGIADAIHIREYLKPGREMSRSMLLEQLRLGRRHPELMTETLEVIDEFLAQLDEQDKSPASAAGFYVSEARDIGLCALPLLAPECWLLPFDVVTVPLHDQV